MNTGQYNTVECGIANIVPQCIILYSNQYSPYRKILYSQYGKARCASVQYNTIVGYNTESIVATSKVCYQIVAFSWCNYQRYVRQKLIRKNYGVYRKACWNLSLYNMVWVLTEYLTDSNKQWYGYNGRGSEILM